ncbi:MAG: hypothetical protein H7289_02525 [Mucilaginibacter sp.]|nr:hypothetical protein [Mucilaginibacter sp.]
MKKIALFFLSALFILGCKTDPPNFDGFTPGTGEVNNSASGYQPTTKGTTWKYTTTNTVTISGQPAPTVVTQQQETTLTGSTIKINNKTYYTANTTVDSEKGYTYYYHDNDTYTYRTNMITPDAVIEYTYLKDNIAIGTTWTEKITDSGLVNGFKAQIIGQVAETGISYTAGGKTYTNVIHTKLKMQYDLGSGYATYQDIDFYIAKGVGIVNTITVNHINSSGVTESPLISYSIK